MRVPYFRGAHMWHRFSVRICLAPWTHDKCFHKNYGNKGLVNVGVCFVVRLLALNSSINRRNQRSGLHCFTLSKETPTLMCLLVLTDPGSALLSDCWVCSPAYRPWTWAIMLTPINPNVKCCQRERRPQWIQSKIFSIFLTIHSTKVL